MSAWFEENWAPKSVGELMMLEDWSATTDPRTKT